MARSRILKAEFFRSRSLARCTIPARLTFVGLWAEADDRGRGVADPRVLKGSVWPLDDDVTPAVIADHLCQLVHTAHIRLYTSEEEVFYDVIRWDKHQAAAYRRGEPKYPDPNDSTVCTFLHADECKKVLSFSFSFSFERALALAAPRTTENAPPAVDNSAVAAADAELDQFDKAVNAALAVRRSQSTVTDESRWAPAARNGIIRDYGKRIRQLLDGGQTPDVAGTVALGKQPPDTQATPPPMHGSSCICDGTGWVPADPDDTSRSACSVRCAAPQTDATVHEIRGPR
jgi:hypothetical protein